MLTHLSFHSPNTLEDGVQKFRDLFDSRQGICYEQPRLVNLPLNRVQSDFDNRHGKITPEYLLARWSEGYAMNVRSLEGVQTNSVHMDLDVAFVQREKSAGEKRCD
jgi:hypothetical protein